MKKVLMILLALAMVFSMTGIVSAEEVPVTYKVEEDYEASIPTDGVALVAATGFTDENVEAKTVGAKYAQIGDDRVLIITMKSANNFNVTYKDSNVQYVAGLLADESTDAYSEFANGAEVLRIPAGTTEGSTQMKFYTTEAWIKKATRSAEHSDSLTFTFTFEDMNNHPAVSQENFQAAVMGAAKGGDVTLVEDVTVSRTESPTAPYGNKVAISMKAGSTFDGNNQKIGLTDSGDDYVIMTEGGTIQNVVIEEGFRGIVIMSPIEDIILKNVHSGGEGVSYALNTAEYPKNGAVVDLIATDCSFAGWSSWAGINSASFTNCKFDVGGYYNNWPYDSLAKPYVTTTFDACDFADKYYLDLSALADGCKVTLKNCKVNGESITSDLCGINCDGTETFCVELPTGRNLADCVIFE